LPIDPSSAFVSYSREDLEFVLRLAKDLKAKGAKVWMDRLDIRPGQRWEAEIEAAVEACSRMLVILTPASIASKNVLAEAALAIDEGKTVIPVLTRECKIPFRLRPLQYADFRTDYTDGLLELMSCLSGERVDEDSISPSPKEPAPLVTSSAVASERVIQPSAAGVGAVQTEFTVEVAEWYRKAVAGDSSAMVWLGLAFENGTGAPQQHQQAFAWYLKAAEAGEPTGMANLGNMYLNGWGVKQDYSRAFPWCLKSANAGDRTGMRVLGYMYLHGQGVEKDYNQAIALSRRAADAGDHWAMNNLGYIYENGCGVQQDYYQAADWYRKATESGNPSAMTSLGNLYFKGCGVGRDLREALELFRRSANAGQPHAMAWLGYMYENGHEVPRDMQQAIAMYSKAAQNGSQFAKDALARLGKNS